MYSFNHYEGALAEAIKQTEKSVKVAKEALNKVDQLKEENKHLKEELIQLYKLVMVSPSMTHDVSNRIVYRIYQLGGTI